VLTHYSDPRPCHGASLSDPPHTYSRPPPGVAEGDGKGGGEGHEIAESEGAVGASEVAPGVGGKEEGDLLEGGERGAGEGIVGEKV